MDGIVKRGWEGRSQLRRLLLGSFLDRPAESQRHKRLGVVHRHDDGAQRLDDEPQVRLIELVLVLKPSSVGVPPRDQGVRRVAR